MSIDFIDKRIIKTKIHNKGYGFVATENIPKNTIILSEYPSFKIFKYKTNTFEIFELIYSILNSNNKEYINKFNKYLPTNIDIRFELYINKIKKQFREMKNVKPQLYKYLNEHCSENDIILYCLKYICNAFDFFDEGPVILLNGSIFNHSCNPNIIFGKITENNNSKMIFITIRNIVKGEELCNSYIDIFLNTNKRKKLLVNQYGFVCNCNVCIKNIAKNDQVLKSQILSTKLIYKNVKFNNV